LPFSPPQGAQVFLGGRLNIGRQHGSVGAFVFPPFPGDLVRGHDRNAPARAAQFLQGGLLMRGIGIGVQEGDGDGLDAFGLEIGDDGRQTARGRARRSSSPL
jgi:hypothetical protein